MTPTIQIVAFAVGMFATFFLIIDIIEFCFISFKDAYISDYLSAYGFAFSLVVWVISWTTVFAGFVL